MRRGRFPLLTIALLFVGLVFGVSPNGLASTAPISSFTIDGETPITLDIFEISLKGGTLDYMLTSDSSTTKGTIVPVYVYPGTPGYASFSTQLYEKTVLDLTLNFNDKLYELESLDTLIQMGSDNKSVMITWKVPEFSDPVSLTVGWTSGTLTPNAVPIPPSALLLGSGLLGLVGIGARRNRVAS